MDHLEGLNWHSQAGTKWQTALRRHFQMHFLERKLLFIIWISLNPGGDPIHCHVKWSYDRPFNKRVFVSGSLEFPSTSRNTFTTHTRGRDLDRQGKRRYAIINTYIHEYKRWCICKTYRHQVFFSISWVELSKPLFYPFLHFELYLGVDLTDVDEIMSGITIYVVCFTQPIPCLLMHWRP